MARFRYIAGILLSLPPLALVGGCPIRPDEAKPASGATLPVSEGTYWVEYGKGMLAIYVLPRSRGEPGTWHVISTRKPDWYTGPALYQVTADHEWARRSDGNEFTLDEIIQLHDPAPAVP